MKDKNTTQETEDSGEDLIDVLSLEVLGPIKRALNMWDCDGAGSSESAEFYAIRDAYILANIHMERICDLIKRDVGNLQIDATWNNANIAEDREYKKAFISKTAEVPA